MSVTHLGCCFMRSSRERLLETASDTLELPAVGSAPGAPLWEDGSPPVTVPSRPVSGEGPPSAGAVPRSLGTGSARLCSPDGCS